MKPFEGKVALVTGATSGLGEAAALRFAAGGAQALFVRTDVSRSAAVDGGETSRLY